MSKKKKTVKKSVHKSAPKLSKTSAGNINAQTNKIPLNKGKSTAKKPCDKTNSNGVKKSTRKKRIGATLSTNDNVMTKKSKNKKRWLAVIEENEKGELGVVYLESQKRKNNRLLRDFSAGNKLPSYYSEFLEIEDADGLPIKVGKKFNQNNNKARLNDKQINAVKTTLYETSNKKAENISKREKLHKKKKPDS